MFPVVVQRQVPAIQKVQKTGEVPQVQYIDRIMDLPVVKRHLEPTIQTEQKTAEVRDAQNLDQVIDMHVETQQQLSTLLIGTAVDVPVMAHRQVHSIQRVQKTVEVPQIQFIDKFVDAPVGVQAEPEIELKATTPLAEDRTGVNLNITDATPPVADPSCRKRKGSDITHTPRVRAVTRTHHDDDRCEIFIGDIASTDETEEDSCAHAVVPASSRAQRELDDTKSAMECVKEELKKMKKMLEFLVRRERKVDVRTEVAVKGWRKSGTRRKTRNAKPA